MADTSNARYWQEKLDEFGRTELETVRTEAAKWQGAISALLGVFGSVAFITGTSAIDKLDSGDATIAKWAVSVSAILALVAVSGAAYAAMGLSKKKNPDWAWLESESRRKAKRAAGFLTVSKWIAGLAVVIVTSGSILILAKSEPKADTPGQAMLVELDQGGTVCGVLADQGSGVVLQVDGVGKALSEISAVLTLVSSCPAP